MAGQGIGAAHLPHAVLPAHAVQARGRQDDSAELLLVQLLEPCVEVSPLWRDAKDLDVVPSALNCPLLVG